MIREKVREIARRHKLDVHDVLELYDAFRMDGMPELDAAVKALSITSVVSGVEPMIDDIENEPN